MKSTKRYMLIVAVCGTLALNVATLTLPDRAVMVRNHLPVPQPTNPSENQKAMARAARTVIERAPMLRPLPPGALSKQDFINLTRQVLNKDDINDLTTAVKELRNVIAQDLNPTTATITSAPSGYTVKYKPWLDFKSGDRGNWLTINTPASPEVDEMTIFRCRTPNGHNCGEVIQPCDNNHNCIASFPASE